MEREYIQKLLDSYMAAETTKEEEQLLSDYFSTHRDIPAEWRDFSILFRGIRQYERKPYVSYRRTIMKWSVAVAAAVVVAVFIMRAPLTPPTETSCKSRLPEYYYKAPSPISEQGLPTRSLSGFSSYEDIVNEIERSGRQLEDAIAQL